MLAVCRWFAETQYKDEKYKLTIFVNDVQAKELDIDDGSQTQVIDIPAELLKGEKQRVRFEINGRGRFAYQCVLGGFVPSNKLKSTTKDWEVVRYYEPAPIELDGRIVPRGFDVLKGSYQSFRNSLSQLPVARRARVELQVKRHQSLANTSSERLPYLIVTEPVPVGTAIIEDTIKGDFERFDIRPGSITFYIGTRGRTQSIRYEVHGYLQGQYSVTPTIVRDSYRPDQMAVSQSKEVTVLALGRKSTDEYRLTPRELFELGRRHFENENFAEAGKNLGALLGSWSLAEKFFKPTVTMLLDVHLKNGPPNAVVRYFEIIVEKYPDYEISFDNFLKIGDAYHEIGEYERSYLVFRATVEASFVRESLVAGFLQRQGEFLRSVDVMNGLLREYPPESYLATAQYALAQRVYAKAPEAASEAKLRDKKITRVDLIKQAWQMLDHFLAAYPNDPAADQASFSLANALLELEVYKKAITACAKFAERYPKSDYLDSYWYITGYCHFALGEHKDALSMCDKVAKSKQIDKRTGRETESRNKWRAIYILGQIHHSLGQAADAIE
jgi:outer membrane protein assembly factor BamD (BamD/ComL family)